MNYPIPVNSQEVAALRERSVSPELIAAVIAGTIQITRAEGRSLDDLMGDVLKDDALLDFEQRQWLSELIAVAWKSSEKESQNLL
jgi:hypothetical protein